MRVNEQGRSMIEMLGVLAIVGVLSVGGIAGYSKAMAKFKANKVIDQVTMISTNIRTLYASQRTFNGLNNVLAKQTNAIPAEMFDNASNSVINNGFGGNVHVGTADHLGKPDQAYVIGFDSIPKAACVTMATTDWGGDAGSGFAWMSVSQVAEDAGATFTMPATVATALEATGNPENADSDTYFAIPGGAGNQASPLSVVAANSACQSDTNNVFVWKYI